MEKHKCKLCFRSFYNGRALGGHMRSHMMNLPIPPKPEEEPSPTPPLPPPIQLSVDAESASSSSSSSDEEEADDEKLSAYYGLRENPKRSIRLVDPEFSFAVDAGSVVLQDRESETESSKNPTRRRSKRTRKSGMLELQYHHLHQKIQQQDEEEAIIINKIKFNKLISKTESWAEPEPVSSVSDTTTEEDVAFCLMMLSRDKWKKQEGQDEEGRHQLEDEQEHEAEKSLEDSDESEALKSSRNRTRGKYKCETCKKVFRSYQALGGHRASHKKIKVSNPAYEPELVQENAGTTSTFRSLKKIHECPVCFRVFSSGQALGGHKRSHVTGSSATSVKSLTKFGDSLIDLNLPAPMEDDEISQIELSAVSDAEFVNPITH